MVGRDRRSAASAAEAMGIRPGRNLEGPSGQMKEAFLQGSVEGAQALKLKPGRKRRWLGRGFGRITRSAFPLSEVMGFLRIKEPMEAGGVGGDRKAGRIPGLSDQQLTGVENKPADIRLAFVIRYEGREVVVIDAFSRFKDDQDPFS